MLVARLVHAAHTRADCETARTLTITKVVKFEACEPTKIVNEKVWKNDTSKVTPWKRRANIKTTTKTTFGSDFTKTVKRA